MTRRKAKRRGEKGRRGWGKRVAKLCADGPWPVREDALPEERKLSLADVPEGLINAGLEELRTGVVLGRGTLEQCTPRQLTIFIMRRLPCPQSAVAIAEILHVSPATVQREYQRAVEKIGFGQK